MKKYLIIVFIPFSSFAFSQALAPIQRDSLFTSPNTGNTFVRAMFTDTLSKKVYVGGHFELIGKRTFNSIAQWDGTKWNSFKDGVNGSVSSIEQYNNDIYIGGTFVDAASTIQNISRWNGNSWVPVGTKPDGSIYKLFSYNGELYAGGNFTHIGGIAANSVAKWDGSNWVPLGNGFNGSVLDMLFYNGELYACGGFTQSGGINCAYISKWTGNKWDSLSVGADALISRMAVMNNKLYVTGQFSTIGGVNIRGLACWDGNNWTDFTNNFFPDLNAGGKLMKNIANKIYFNPDLNSGSKIYSFDGTNISSIVNVPNDIIFNATNYNNDIWLEGLAMPYVSKFTNRPIVNFNSTIDSLCTGLCLNVINSTINPVTKWSWELDGASISTSPNKNPGIICYTAPGNYKIKLTATNAYGNDSLIKFIKVKNKTNANWLPVGNYSMTPNVYSPIPEVRALVVDTIKKVLYAGGSFKMYTSTDTIINIAKWDGIKWSKMCDTIDGVVSSLIMYKGELHMGGAFYSINSISVKGIVKWNGFNWSNLGLGIAQNGGAQTNQLKIIDSLLYVVGIFDIVDGITDITRANIANWDGNKWSTLPSVPNGLIPKQIERYNNDLYVCGANGPNQVWKYFNSSWQPIDTNVTGNVYTLKQYKGELFVGGDFLNGGKNSNLNLLSTWNGFKWNPAPVNLSLPYNYLNIFGNVYNLDVFRGELYISGNLYPKSNFSQNILKWDGINAIPIGSGVNGNTYNAITFSIGGIYFGGDFNFSGGCQPVQAIAYWPLKPHADLFANPLNMCVNDSLQLYDNSQSNISSWNWDLPGALPSSSTQQNPKVVYKNPGSYTVKLKVGNGLGQDSITKTNYITIAPLPNPVISSMVQPKCGANSGTISVAVSTGTPPYIYLWQPSGNTTNTLIGLDSGKYVLHIVDALGCTSSVVYPLADSCSLVWPGDADNNGTADNTDLLAIGTGYGKTGTPRLYASTNWTGQPSLSWADTLSNGTNYKHIDCNGDATIDSNDTLSILLNYGLTHPLKLSESKYIQGIPDIYIKCLDDTVIAGNSTRLQIGLGTSLIQASNVYGFAFSIDFNNINLVNIPTANFSPVTSWLGTKGGNLISICHSNTLSNNVNLAICKTDKVNSSGYGIIGEVTFKTATSYSGNAIQMLKFLPNLVKTITKNGSVIPVNLITDSLVVKKISTGITPSYNSNSILISPNPFTEETLIHFHSVNSSFNLVVYDVTGREVKRVVIEKGHDKYILQRADLSDGIYILKGLDTEQSTIFINKLIVANN